MFRDAQVLSQLRNHVKIPRTIRGVRIVEDAQTVRTLDINGAVEERRASRFQAPVNLFQFTGSRDRASFSAKGDLLAIAVAGAGVELWQLAEKRQIPLSTDDIGEVFLPLFNESGG